MTDEEIARDLRMAKDPYKQCKIIHELTFIPRDRIMRIYQRLLKSKSFSFQQGAKKLRKWSDDDIAEIIRLRDIERLSFPKIGKIFDVTGNCIGIIYRKYKGETNAQTMP